MTPLLHGCVAAMLLSLTRGEPALVVTIAQQPVLSLCFKNLRTRV